MKPNLCGLNPGRAAVTRVFGEVSSWDGFQMKPNLCRLNPGRAAVARIFGRSRGPSQPSVSRWRGVIKEAERLSER